MSIKLIASDIDGTIINDQGEVSAATKAVIGRLKEHDIRFVLATGRSYESGLEIAQQLEIVAAGYGLICLNGLHTYNFPHAGYRSMESLRYEDCVAIGHVGQNFYMGVLYCFDDKIYLQMDETTYQDYKISMDDHKLRFFNDHLKAEPISDITAIQHRFEPGQDPIQKMVFIQSDSFMDLLIDRVRVALPDTMEAVMVGKGWTEIMPNHVTKGNALIAYAEQYGIKPEEIMVFGDAENDISMFKMAGHPVAMENAMETVKIHTPYITLTNDEDGVAAYINTYLDSL